MKTGLNERVRLLRMKIGLTQQQFAELCGVTNTTIHRLEKGENEPQQTTINSIITKTGVSEDWLLRGVGNFEIKNVITNVIDNVNADAIYKDALYLELKENANTWKQKYEDVFAMLSKVLDRGGNLGKSKALKYTAFVNLSNVLRAVA